MARVSILMALYNHEKYLATAVESVINQTYLDWELIIWDDGSRDRSLKIAREFEVLHSSQIKVFTHPENKNRGQENTRNAALEKASGEFIGLLDSDDFYHPRKLELLVPCFANSKVGLAFGRADFLSEATREIYDSGIYDEPSGNVFKPLIEENFICAGATLFRRECVQHGLRFDPEFKTIGEYPLWLKIAKDWEFRFVPEKVAVWRYHGENLGSQLALQAKLELVKLCERLLADESYFQFRDEIVRALAKKRYDYASDLYGVLDLEGVRNQCALIVKNLHADPIILAKAAALLTLSYLGKPPNRVLSRGKRLIWEMRHRDLVKR